MSISSCSLSCSLYRCIYGDILSWKRKVHRNIALFDQILTGVSLAINMSGGGDYGWLGRGASSCRSSSLMQINVLPLSRSVCLPKKLLSQAPYILGCYTSYQRERGHVDANAKAHLLNDVKDPAQKVIVIIDCDEVPTLLDPNGGTRSSPSPNVRPQRRSLRTNIYIYILNIQVSARGTLPVFQSIKKLDHQVSNPRCVCLRASLTYCFRLRRKTLGKTKTRPEYP